MFLHTHGCRRSEGIRAFEYANTHGWVPPEDSTTWAWKDIPKLAGDFASGLVESYFPVYEVNVHI
jgi:hypothetical protein